MSQLAFEAARASYLKQPPVSVRNFHLTVNANQKMVQRGRCHFDFRLSPVSVLDSRFKSLQEVVADSKCKSSDKDDDEHKHNLIAKACQSRPRFVSLHLSFTYLFAF